MSRIVNRQIGLGDSKYGIDGDRLLAFLRDPANFLTKIA